MTKRLFTPVLLALALACVLLPSVSFATDAQAYEQYPNFTPGLSLCQTDAKWTSGCDTSATTAVAREEAKQKTLLERFAQYIASLREIF